MSGRWMAIVTAEALYRKPAWSSGPNLCFPLGRPYAAVDLP